MQFDNQPGRLGQNGMRAGPPSLLARVLAVVIGAAVLVVAFFFSLVLLAVILGAAVVIGGYLWWKTRALRKQIREQAIRAQQMHEQEVRERAGQRMDTGNVVEDVEFHDETRRK